MLIINAVIFNLACKITDFLKKKGQIGTFNTVLSIVLWQKQWFYRSFRARANLCQTRDNQHYTALLTYHEILIYIHSTDTA
ncbi:hypothetical protein SAMN04488505_105364 [Chitinophaga rupis]|jgi:hypothetical protein|uniref:Uncharacterized protein n=1 Tax=Chitinophaga rupis TaxID=573321 RepID=A0A1H8ABU8_9BACT|nr:hypothetical protein SAMN04488505_105364 [Chitinophaga rupis]